MRSIFSIYSGIGPGVKKSTCEACLGHLEIIEDHIQKASEACLRHQARLCMKFRPASSRIHENEKSNNINVHRVSIDLKTLPDRF